MLQLFILYYKNNKLLIVMEIFQRRWYELVFVPSKIISLGLYSSKMKNTANYCHINCITAKGVFITLLQAQNNTGVML